MAKKRKRKLKVSATGYTRIIRHLAKLRRSGKYRKWRTKAQLAAAYRKRLIAANARHAPQPMGGQQACQMQDAKTRKLYAQMQQTADGRKVARRFAKFWKVPCPPSIRTIRGGPKGTIPLVGMGTTKKAVFSSKDYGQRGAKRIELKGNWTVATEATGRHVLLLSSRPLSGKLVPVGYAAETWYIPPPDVEQAGTHKAGLIWRHQHANPKEEGMSGKKLHYPRVYADRGGKVDSQSNFVYGKTPTARIEEWMYGN